MPHTFMPLLILHFRELGRWRLNARSSTAVSGFSTRLPNCPGKRKACEKQIAMIA